MATVYPLPDVARVKSMLGMMFDGLEVKQGGKLDMAPTSNAYVGVFVGDDGKPGALCACDLPLASNIASALSMLPPAAAKDAAKSKQLTEVMLANLREVMNICSRLLIVDGSPHLKLDQVYEAKAVPEPARAIVAGAKGRIDFEIGVAKYGPGVMSVLSI
jgi:hypothetical protein